MSPPIDIDGSKIKGATIDGQDVSKITIDGQQAFIPAELPDKANLQARYDATRISAGNNDSIGTWSDETTNGHDLTGNNRPIYKPNIINGKPVVRFDGNDDALSVSWSPISQPNVIFAVTQKRSTNDNYLFDSKSGSDRHLLNISSGNFLVGTSRGNFTGSPVDTSPHILTMIFDGSSSKLRIDGTVDATGNPGGDSMEGLTLGNENSRFGPGDWDVGEFLVYHTQPTVTDVESFLSSKWGISI